MFIAIIILLLSFIPILTDLFIKGKSLGMATVVFKSAFEANEAVKKAPRTIEGRLC